MNGLIDKGTAQGSAATPGALASRNSSQGLRACIRASADLAAATLSGQLGGGFSAPVAAHVAD